MMRLKKISLLLLTLLAGNAYATPTPIASPTLSPGISDFALWHFSLPDVSSKVIIHASTKPFALFSKSQPGADLTPLTQSHLNGDGDRDIVNLVAPTNLWQRIRDGFGMSNISSSAVVMNEQWYTDRPDYIIRMVDRSKKYLFHIVEALEKRNMPTELALLPFVESAYNPHAVSPAKAAGIWQFMPATGKYFDLVQNAFRDDRRDVLASTNAALDYLQKLHDLFGSWQLALAAYNWGEGSVSRAIAKNERLGLPTDFENLNLPQETRYYLPKLQAIKNIISAPSVYGAPLPNIGNHPYFESVSITRDMDVTMIAKLAEISVQDFKSLNPSLNRPVVLAEGNPTILLPWDNCAIFKKNLEKHGNQNLTDWTVWVSPRTYRASEIAYRFDMNETEFREVNKIPQGMLVKAGSALLVPKESSPERNVSQQVADSGQVNVAPEARSRIIYVRPRSNETVATFARRYKLAPAEVAEWNNLREYDRLNSKRRIKLRVPIRIPEHQKYRYGEIRRVYETKYRKEKKSIHVYHVDNQGLSAEGRRRK